MKQYTRIVGAFMKIAGAHQTRMNVVADLSLIERMALVEPRVLELERHMAEKGRVPGRAVLTRASPYPGASPSL